MSHYETRAYKYNKGMLVRKYLLKCDDKGFFFDGAHCASFRRKTRKGIEGYMEKLGYDIVDLEVN